MENSFWTKALTINALPAILIASLISGCSVPPSQKQISPFQSQPEVRASAEISDSFAVELRSAFPVQSQLVPEDSTLHTQGYDVVIAESALEKEFLLQASMILQPRAALGSGLKSRVVAFRDRGDTLIMLEGTAGHSVTRDTPQNLVLATFPIKERVQTPKGMQIRFDFNKGMADLFISGDWRASDFEGTSYNEGREFFSVPLKNSYLESVAFVSNHLVLRQVARINLPSLLIPVEVKYYLSPYQPHSDFQPSLSNSNFDRMGFFETAPFQKVNQVSLPYYTKFNDQKPIIFALSSNTPEEYRQAVRDGVLYWNKAFGKALVQVIDAPAGLSAPDLEYNIIQWVEWDDAGFAYADGQMDPRSGEILHAQVYFTSAFAVGGKAQARRLLKELDLQNKNPMVQKIIGLQGFTQDSLCQRQHTDAFRQSLLALVDAQVDDSVILKASQDYVREVAAHEIGHTLGLRHNFAGSLAANYEISKRPELIKTYLSTQRIPDGLQTTSSVMEYQRFEESAMTGDYLAHGAQSLPYDEKAIRVLYQKAEYRDEEIPLYCTDSHRAFGQFLDCNVFDFGNQYVSFNQWNNLNRIEQIPNMTLQTFIQAKAPPTGLKAIALNKASLLSHKNAIEYLLSAQFKFLDLLSGQEHLLSVQRQVPVVDGDNETEIFQKENQILTQQIKEIGGWSKILNKDDAETLTSLWTQRFETLLEQHKTGVGLAGQTYEFTPEELEFIKAKSKRYFSNLAMEVQKQRVSVVTGRSSTDIDTPPIKLFHKDFFPEELTNLFSEFAFSYLTETTGETMAIELEVPNLEAKADEPKTKKITIHLPHYRYPFEQRKLAATIFRTGRSASPFWGVIPKRNLATRFNEHTKSILTISLDSIKAETMPTSEAAQWILENQALTSSIQFDF